MVRVSVLYPDKSGGHFDFDYYLNTHIPLVEKLLESMRKVEVDRAAGQTADTAPFRAIAHLLFESLEDFQKEFDRHGKTLLEDVPNFTNLNPRLQVSRVVKP